MAAALRAWEPEQLEIGRTLVALAQGDTVIPHGHCLSLAVIAEDYCVDPHSNLAAIAFICCPNASVDPEQVARGAAATEATFTPSGTRSAFPADYALGRRARMPPPAPTVAAAIAEYLRDPGAAERRTARVYLGGGSAAGVKAADIDDGPPPVLRARLRRQGASKGWFLTPLGIANN